MNEPERPGRDDVGDLLGRPGETGGEALRTAVLARTLRVVRRRRLVRRLELAAALAACYVAGLLTLAAWRPAGPVAAPEAGPAVVSGTAVEPAPAVTATLPAAVIVEAPQPAPPETVPPIVEPPALSRYEVLCRMGDRYLRETGSVAKAVELYKQALSVASAEEQAVSVNHDSWVLVAMKDARINEKGSSHDDRKRG